MDYYLVDFENISANELINLKGLNKGDYVALFYSKACDSIKLEVFEALAKKNLQISCYKAVTGAKNSLDFQLSSFLGYLVRKSVKEDKIHIVSKDKGYDCLAKFWKNKKLSVDRVEPAKAEATKKKKKSPETSLANLEEIKQVVKKEDDPEAILEIFNKFKTKVDISIGISKKFRDSKRAGNVYQCLKPLLAAKNKK